MHELKVSAPLYNSNRGNVIIIFKEVTLDLAFKKVTCNYHRIHELRTNNVIYIQLF